MILYIYLLLRYARLNDICLHPYLILYLIHILVVVCLYGNYFLYLRTHIKAVPLRHMFMISKFSVYDLSIFLIDNE